MTEARGRRESAPSSDSYQSAPGPPYGSWVRWGGGGQEVEAVGVHCVQWPDRDATGPVLARDGANHVDDPSVAVYGGAWFMSSTVATTGEVDRILLAPSPGGCIWIPQGMVLAVVPAGARNSYKVGRPSVLVNDGVTLPEDPDAGCDACVSG